MIYRSRSQLCDVELGKYQTPRETICNMNLRAMEASGSFRNWEILE